MPTCCLVGSPAVACLVHVVRCGIAYSPSRLHFSRFFRSTVACNGGATRPRSYWWQCCDIKRYKYQFGQIHDEIETHLKNMLLLARGLNLDTPRRPAQIIIMEPFEINPMLKQKRRPYTIQRDVDLLEKSQCVTKVLQSERFRGHLEGVLKGYVDGSVGKKLKSLQKLQANVVPASQIEAGRVSHQRPSPASHIIPINDLRGALLDRYTVAECQARCKLASLYRVIDRMGLTEMIYNHISVSV